MLKPQIVTDQHGQRQMNRRKRRKRRRADAECGVKAEMDRGWRGWRGFFDAKTAKKCKGAKKGETAWRLGDGEVIGRATFSDRVLGCASQNPGAPPQTQPPRRIKEGATKRFDAPKAVLERRFQRDVTRVDQHWQDASATATACRLAAEKEQKVAKEAKQARGHG